MRLLGAFALAGLAVACAREVPPGPPVIRLGVDVCDGCGMSISEARYACAVVGDLNGEHHVLVFDDIGCFARWETKTPGFISREGWVHDRNSERWIDAEDAVFVRSPSWATPMGSGIAAFSRSADTGVSASPMSWRQVIDLARRGELDVPMSRFPPERAR